VPEEQQTFPRSHSEWDLKSDSDKRGICQAQERSPRAELVPPDAGKNTITETNPKLLLGLPALSYFPARGWGRPAWEGALGASWGAGHPARAMQRAQGEPARSARPFSGEGDLLGCSRSKAPLLAPTVPGSPPSAATCGAGPSRELVTRTEAHEALQGRSGLRRDLC